MRGVIRIAVVTMMSALTVVIGARGAFAETAFTEPSDEPVVVTVADDGWPAAVTVKVSGFEPFQNVYIEQCNGRTPDDEDWSAAVDCDPGSAPAAAVTDEAGVATFSADDPNHAFRPFVGASPQRSFNCLGPDAPSPSNEIEQDFRECQIRVSSNNTRSTSDQVFLRMELPNRAKEWSPEIVPGAVTPGEGAAETSTGAGTDQAAAGESGSSSGDLAASSSDASDSESDGLPVLALAALLVVAAALGVGLAYLVRRRRTKQVVA